MGKTGIALDFDESIRPRLDARCRSAVAAALLIVLATSRRMEVASGEVKTLLTLEAGWTVHTMLSGQRRVWIAAWNGLAASQQSMELIALDWATGNVALQGRREMPWATPRWSNFEVIEAQDGAVWIANGYTGRVERMDESGAWQGWPLDGRTPSNLVAARFGAACLLQQLQPPSEPQNSGGPIEAPTVLRRELAAFQPGTPTFVTYPVETHVSLLADRAGGVRVEGFGQLALENGRLLIVPAPGSATELPKPPS